MAKKNVFVIKEDKEIVEGVFLCKGDMLIESGKGRWTIIEAEDDEEDKAEDEKEKKEEAEGDEEDKDEDKKEESKEDDDKMAAMRAKKEARAKK